MRLVVAFVMAACASRAGITVWVAEDLYRVRPQDAPGTARKAAIKAARNEWASFQVIVNGGAYGLKSVNATAGELRGKRGRIGGITLYREHYVAVKTPSPFSKEGAGWYPDALIPFGPLIDVEAGRNQPLWIDVKTPKDAAPGVYSGAITITAKGENTVKIPVELTAWDFTLPDMPTLRTHFGGPRAQWYGGAIPREAWRLLAEAQSAHKISPPIPPYLYPQVGADGTIDPASTHAELKDWMERYRVNAFDVRLQGKDPLGADRARNVRYLQSMWKYLKANGWDKYAHVYVTDEPNTREAYDLVRTRAAFIHETQPGLKVLCTEQPTPQNPEWGNLFGAIDIWVPLFPLYERSEEHTS